MFAAKFNAIMNIAGVTNSMAGRSVAISGSHIGRLRHGVRALPKNHDFLLPLCYYISQHITEDYQLTALKELTGLDKIPTTEEMAAFLEKWLLNDVYFPGADLLVTNFSNFKFELSPKPKQTPTSSEGLQEDTPYYYGNAGKRQAVIRFFNMILQTSRPQTLLLFSDEPFTWLYEDMAFAKQWRALFIAVLQQGNRVKIVHTINRDFNEMMEALSKWIPVYMTGAIEPYYYPHLRDGVSKRTLFIAPKTAAIVSSSIQHHTEGMLHFFVTERPAIAALVEEFNHFFSLCRPLMKILTPQKLQNFFVEQERIGEKMGNGMISCAMPFLFAMPEEMAKRIAEEKNAPAFYELWHRSFIAFQRSIKENHLTGVVMTREALLSQMVPLAPALACLTFPEGFSYSVEDYHAHFNALEQLAKHHENFTLVQNDQLPLNMLMFYKEDARVMMVKSSDYPIAFIFDEYHLVEALGTYMKKQIPMK